MEVELKERDAERMHLLQLLKYKERAKGVSES